MGDVSNVNATVLLYFAYGSNLLAERFFINNKGTRLGTGKLMDYSLGFNLPDEYWAGNVATIMPKKGGHVMGAIWVVASDISLLDEYARLSLSKSNTIQRILPDKKKVISHSPWMLKRILERLFNAEPTS